MSEWTGQIRSRDTHALSVITSEGVFKYCPDDNYTLYCSVNGGCRTDVAVSYKGYSTASNIDPS